MVILSLGFVTFFLKTGVTFASFHSHRVFNNLLNNMHRGLATSVLASYKIRGKFLPAPGVSFILILLLARKISSAWNGVVIESVSVR